MKTTWASADLGITNISDRWEIAYTSVRSTMEIRPMMTEMTRKMATKPLLLLPCRACSCCCCCCGRRRCRRGNVTCREGPPIEGRASAPSPS